jgi:hypothetical protein
MGTWGPGLLENDVALDALGTFDDLVLQGASVEDAIKAVMDESEDVLEDEDDRPDLILALAWLASERQATPGWLAAQARAIIAGEVTLSRWEESDHYETRRAFEQTLVAILDGTSTHPGRPGHLLPGQES